MFTSFVFISTDMIYTASLYFNIIIKYKINSYHFYLYTIKVIELSHYTKQAPVSYKVLILRYSKDLRPDMDLSLLISHISITIMRYPDNRNIMLRQVVSVVNSICL